MSDVSRECALEVPLGHSGSDRSSRSLLSAQGVSIEQISQLVGHKSTQVTETVYRHELRPVLTEGAEAMDEILPRTR